MRLNDTDEFDTVTCEIEIPPAKGSAWLEFDTRYESRTHLELSSRNVTIHNYTLFYTPETGGVYEDSVKLRLFDGFDSVVATIPIEVYNSEPIALSDEPGVECLKNVGCSVGFDELLHNDYDPNGDIITVDTTYDGNGESVVYDIEKRMVAFTPQPNVKEASFLYRATDAPSNKPEHALVSNVATVTLTLLNKPPVAADYNIDVFMNREESIDLLVDCSDPNNDPIEISSVGSTVRADDSSVRKVDSRFVLYKAPNYVTEDAFEYSVKDDEGAESVRKGVVKINVLNNPPEADVIETTSHWRRDENDPLRIDIRPHVRDVDGSDVTLTSVSYSGSEATVSVADNKHIMFRPSPSVKIHDVVFDYTVTDGFDTTTSQVCSYCRYSHIVIEILTH